MEKKKTDNVKVGQSLHYAKQLIEEMYYQTPELEENIKREELSLFKNPLPKIDGGMDRDKAEKESFKDLNERMKNLKKPEDFAGQRFIRHDIDEEFEKARAILKELDKAVTQFNAKKNDMEDRYIRREQELRNRIKEREEEIGRKGGLDQLPDKKKVSDIRTVHTDIIGSIDDLQKKTDKALEQERNIIKTFFQGELMKLQEEFDKQKDNQATSSEGQKEDEKELKSNLELVTSIAQHIDTVNRKLAKRREELRIEVKAQENDIVMLQSQFSWEKGRTKKLEKELERLKKIAAEAKVEYENEKSQDVSGQKIQDISAGGSKILPPGVDKSMEKSVRNTSQKFDLPEGEDAGKAEKYETIISQLKKRINIEQANIRQVKTMYTKEIETRLELEQLLRKCVDDVKAEINAKRAENRVLMHSSSLKKRGGVDNAGLTQEDREKIIEVLLSQERVLTLLYDKTFPPRALLKQGEGMANLSTYDLEELLDKAEEAKKTVEPTDK